MNYQMYVPTRVLFGEGSLEQLHAQSMPGRRALLVISNGKSVRANGALERTQAQLAAAGVSAVLFDQIEANPLRSTVMRGAQAARDGGCDFVVALGGGSVMDAAKAIAAMAVNPGDLWDYVSGGTGKARALEHGPLPLVAVTTTAGTGSEVDAWGVITNEDTHEKIGFGGRDDLFPVLAIVDPKLMYTVPPAYTAYQGFDALFHSTECYIGKFANPMSDMVARTAMENIGAYLPRAVKDGADGEARAAVAFANTLSGYAMVAASTTSEHSLEHAMSAYHQSLPHGAGLIMISLAYYRHFIERHACDDRFVSMARFLGKTDAHAPEDFLSALEQLQRDCGVDALRMSDYGISLDECEKMAHNAMETMGGLFLADRIALTPEDCAQIYRRSYR